MVIEIRPDSGGWRVFGDNTSGPYFTGPAALEHAIDYACERARFHTAHVRLIARNGTILKILVESRPGESIVHGLASRVSSRGDLEEWERLLGAVPKR